MLYLIFCLFICLNSIGARPIGAGFSQSDYIDYAKNWNQELEEAEVKYPYLENKHWESHSQKHLDALGFPLTKQPNPFLNHKRSLAINTYYIQSKDWDQVLGYSFNSFGGVNEAIKFNTKGLAFEGSGKIKLGGYHSNLSWLRFYDKEELNFDPNNQGYMVVFGDRNSEIKALANTKFNLINAGNQRQIYQGHSAKLHFLQGLSYLHLKRFERLRGVDKLGLNSGSVLREPNLASGLSDPVIIEQGEDLVQKTGMGAFLGLGYQQEIADKLSLNTNLKVHLLSLTSKQDLLIDKISSIGIIDSSSTQFKKTEQVPLIDFSIAFEKWFRSYYNVNLGFRYIDVGDLKSKGLSNLEKGNFTLKGFNLGFQRLF